LGWDLGKLDSQGWRIPAEQSPSPVEHSEPSIDLGGEFREVPVRNLPGIVDMFDEQGAWPFPSPKPGERGCRVPSRYLPQHLQATGTDG
jgi:hypothetical protein